MFMSLQNLGLLHARDGFTVARDVALHEEAKHGF